jgi:adenylate cyclase
MAQEIEKKFLVKEGTDINSLGNPIEITQGYLSSVKERTVRVRIKGSKGFLTIKGIGNSSGASRYEFEKEISIEEAKELLELCEKPILSKTRTNVKVGNHTFEVDRFLLENEGLIVAEVELKDEHEAFEKPQWLDQEVTGDVKYYNSMLLKNPYKDWK